MKAKVQFWESLASMLDAGIPVRTALEHAAAERRGVLGEALRGVALSAGAGRPLWEGMASHPRVFRRLEVEIVRAAETTGTLSAAARGLARDEARADVVRGRLLTRALYPAFILHFVPVPLNVGHLVEGHFGRFLAGWAGFLLPLWIAGAAAFLWVRAARTSGGAARVLLALPVIGGLLRDLAWIRWARAYAVLEDSGIPADACALRAAAVTGYAHLERALAAPAAALASGRSRAEAFAPAPLPPDLRRALATGEVSGTVSGAVGHAAGLLEHSVATRTDAIVAMVPPVLMVIVGLVVAWVVLGFYGSLYGL